MLALLLSSAFAFSFLNFSKTAKRARKSNLQHDFDLNVSQIELVTKDEEVIISEKKDLVPVKCLMAIAFWAAFIQYGFLPGLLSYSTIPYGNNFFHLSINLSKFIIISNNNFY